MAALCSSRCGYCGGCTAEWEREDDDREIEQSEPEPNACEVCGEELGPHAVVLTIGLFCSTGCLDSYTVLHQLEAF